MITFTCARCSEVMHVPESMSGQTVECPMCQNINSVPVMPKSGQTMPHVIGGEAPTIVVNTQIQNVPATDPIAMATGHSNQSRLVYILLALFLGGLGIHNFYVGRNGPGAAQLILTLIGCLIYVTLPVVFIWVIIEIITVDRDGKGRRLI